MWNTDIIPLNCGRVLCLPNLTLTYDMTFISHMVLDLIFQFSSQSMWCLFCTDQKLWQRMNSIQTKRLRNTTRFSALVVTVYSVEPQCLTIFLHTVSWLWCLYLEEKVKIITPWQIFKWWKSVKGEVNRKVWPWTLTLTCWIWQSVVWVRNKQDYPYSWQHFHIYSVYIAENGI